MIQAVAVWLLKRRVPYDPKARMGLATGTFATPELAVKATGLGLGHGGASQMSRSRRQSRMLSLSYDDRDDAPDASVSPGDCTGRFASLSITAVTRLRVEGDSMLTEPPAPRAERAARLP